jgi:hypothetical protein
MDKCLCDLEGADDIHLAHTPLKVIVARSISLPGITQHLIGGESSPASENQNGS